MKKHKWLIFVAVAILGLSTFYFTNKKKSNVQNTIKIARGSISEAVYGIGTVTANKSFILKVPIASNIREVYVREGDSVKTGQNLIRLEDIPTFKAPFNGTVTEINYKIGETVTPQSIILGLVDLKDRYLSVALEQQGAVKVLKGQNTHLSFESMRDKPFSGKVEATYVKENQFMVRISGDQLPEQLLPGMTVDVAIEISKKENALLVPANAVTKGTLALIQDGSIKLVTIKTGLVDGSMVEVLSDSVKEGDMVLLNAETK